MPEKSAIFLYKGNLKGNYPILRFCISLFSTDMFTNNKFKLLLTECVLSTLVLCIILSNSSTELK